MSSLQPRCRSSLPVLCSYLFISLSLLFFLGRHCLFYAPTSSSLSHFPSFSNSKRFTFSFFTMDSLSKFAPGTERPDPLLQLAKELNPQPLRKSSDLGTALTLHRGSLEHNHHETQYLALKSVPPATISTWRHQQTKNFKTIRTCYNATQQLLILKVMPNDAHETPSRMFNTFVDTKLLAMGIDYNVVVPTGTSTVRIGDWTKEPDSSWAPVAWNGQKSFVLEVGLSESDPHLFQMARGWLESPDTTVQLVVTLSISRRSPTITFQTWILESHRTMSTRGYSPSAIVRSQITLTRDGNVTTVDGNVYLGDTTAPMTQLELPFEKIVGRPPNQLQEQDLVISSDELKQIARGVWRDQGFW
ncbi:unnamed protein product [Penicillium salamii]|uniref:Uncharacterized protein n=1 Tax=Penicillium salamii TaxID=1612424 RepID=A0A9W4JGP2_9EURO|nr:unnamed protein product [Penicillium salamii]CAG8362800.1 unnamed protein product [Penicillium salamii]CAG8369677.1 unnamed protein product [Penicillium salamii]CAG8390337.1 unnamed protein product [Penicillium salamii]